jgi:dTDP-4-amino-4,6-dideoxy-D-galactose acyltransferase
MEIDYLTWDSSFFKKKVGKIQLNSAHDIEVSTLINLGKTQGYDLIYGFLNLQQTSFPHHFDKFRDWYVTTNILYTTSISEHPFGSDPCIRTVFTEKDTSALLSLGIEAGHSSRFKIDSRFPKGSFEKLYHTWVTNSLDKIIADEVFIYDDGTGVSGFVTIKLDKSLCTIGLIAVDANARGQRIGAKLIDAVIAYCQKNEIDTLQVSTQLENLGANNFYKQQGFASSSQTEIYHFWI